MPIQVKNSRPCDGCPMQRLFPENNLVPAKIGTSNRLCIAEAPGESEAEAGEPLVGDSGKLFNLILAKAGIKRDEVTLANCLSCRPPNNDFPTDSDARAYISIEEAEQAVAHCRKAHLEPILKMRKWGRVDLFGDKPLKIVAGVNGSISKYRGSPVVIKEILDSPIAIATYHPSYVMRDQTQFPIVANDLRKSLDTPPEHFNLYPSLADVAAFTATEFAVDIETTREWNPRVKVVGLSSKPYEAIVVPFTPLYIPELKRIFTNAKKVIGFNSVAFDMPVLCANLGIECPAEHIDLMLGHHLRFPDFEHNLGFVASQFLTVEPWKDDQGNFERYNAKDVSRTLLIYHHLWPLLAEANLLDVYKDISVPLAKVCRLLHRTGIKIDPGQITAVREKLLEEQTRLEQDLPAWLRSHQITVNKRQPAPPGTKSEKTGKPLKFLTVEAQETVVPWRSTTQKLKFLYGKEDGCLGAERQFDPKKGTITTGKNALDKLAKRVKPGDKPSIVALKRLNQLDEILTTFCKEGLLEVKRIHANFLPHGTSSGRLASSDPNMQNQPEVIRCIFVPSEEGWEIMSCDFSQLENRLTAWFANDTTRAKRLEDTDFSEHKYLASLIQKIPYDSVVKDNSREAPYGQAKIVVHGSNYLMGAQKIANTFDLDLKTVKNMQNLWKDEIRETVRWQGRTAEQAKQAGFLCNPFGRKRWFWTSSFATEACSFLPQSTGADIVHRCAIAMLYKQIGWTEEAVKRVAAAYEALPEPARMLLQVHDEFVFEYPKHLREEMIRIVTKVMSQSWKELGGLLIPINISVGPSWGQCQKVKVQ